MNPLTESVVHTSVDYAMPPMNGTVRSGTRKIMLISNQVMHYRVSVYNYFHRRFRDSGFEFSVIADRLQEQNQRPCEFELQEVAFDFLKYRKAIIDTEPAALILFLHMKDVITWPLIHWLKMQGIPFAFWTKGGNWDAKQAALSDV